MLPKGGVLLMQVHPNGAPAYALAFTAAELERVFGHVRRTRSWETVRHYHFPTAPAAVNPFYVITTDSTDPGPARTATTSASPVNREQAILARLRRRPRTMQAPEVVATSLYEWARAWAAALGVPVESEAYLRGVTAWRRAWRPDRVKVLLVAESHVAEAAGDRNTGVIRPRWLNRTLPSQYVRLVYCLGYGEPASAESPSPRQTAAPGSSGTSSSRSRSATAHKTDSPAAIRPHAKHASDGRSKCSSASRPGGSGSRTPHRSASTCRAAAASSPPEVCSTDISFAMAINGSCGRAWPTTTPPAGVGHRRGRRHRARGPRGHPARPIDHIPDGRVARQVIYFDRERAFADLGLAQPSSS